MGSHKISVTPSPDESLIGYLFRLAERHRTSSALTLATECGFKRLTNRPRLPWLRALASFARTPIELLQAISFGSMDEAGGKFRGLEFPISVFDRRGSSDRRVCPLCLAERRSHRALWDLIFIAACPVHHVKLVDTCLACAEPLKWRAAGLTRCGCNADITRMSTERVPRDLLRGTKAAYGLLGELEFEDDASYVRSLAPFIDLAPSEIVDFMWRVGLESAAGRRNLFSSKQPGILAWDAHVLMTRSLELAEDWPQSFFNLLKTMRARASAEPGRSLQQSVGAVEKWLRTLPQGHGSVVSVAIADYRSYLRSRSSSVVLANPPLLLE